jgi:hypothetical protein
MTRLLITHDPKIGFPPQIWEHSLVSKTVTHRLHTNLDARLGTVQSTGQPKDEQLPLLPAESLRSVEDIVASG